MTAASPPPPARRHRPGLTAALALHVAILAAAALAGVCLGSSTLSLSEVWDGLTGSPPKATLSIVRGVRLPAVALAAAVGGLLGCSGAAVQGLTRNPLAEPYLLGVSGGAALGVTVATLWGPGWQATAPFAAFGGSLIAMGLVNRLGRPIRTEVESDAGRFAPLLAGVVLNSVAAALVMVAHSLLPPERSQGLLLWLMGSISPGRLREGLGIWPLVVGWVALAGLWQRAHSLNLLSLGDAEAHTAGVDVPAARRRFVWLSSLAVSCAVASAGMIGFVGLIVPHLVRRISGSDARLLLPASAVAGAWYLVAADALTRLAFVWTGASLPVGSLTALVGGPFFLWLLARRA